MKFAILFSALTLTVPASAFSLYEFFTGRSAAGGIYYGGTYGYTEKQPDSRGVHYPDPYGLPGALRPGEVRATCYSSDGQIVAEHTGFSSYLKPQTVQKCQTYSRNPKACRLTGCVGDVKGAIAYGDQFHRARARERDGGYGSLPGLERVPPKPPLAGNPPFINGGQYCPVSACLCRGAYYIGAGAPCT